MTFFNLFVMNNVNVQLAKPDIMKNESKYPDSVNHNINKVKNNFTVFFFFSIFNYIARFLQSTIIIYC